MAWVEQHGNLFHIAFRIGERRFKKTLKSTNRRAADALAQRIDERLRLIDQGHITIPEGVDLVAYLFFIGPPRQTILKAQRAVTRLSQRVTARWALIE